MRYCFNLLLNGRNYQIGEVELSGSSFDNMALIRDTLTPVMQEFKLSSWEVAFRWLVGDCYVADVHALNFRGTFPRWGGLSERLS